MTGTTEHPTAANLKAAVKTSRLTGDNPSENPLDDWHSYGVASLFVP
jgi:hypothetical protein